MSTFSFNDFIFSSLLLVIGYVITFYVKYFTRSNKLPGPLPLPLIGNLTSYNGDLAAWVNYLRSKYGDIGEVWIGGDKAIWLSRAEYLEKVYKFGNYNKRTAPNKGLDVLDMTSKGILFNENYDTWSYNRKFFSKAILAPRFIRKSVNVTQSTFLEMEEYWKDTVQQNGKINMADWSLRFFAEIIFLIAINKKSDSLNNYHKASCATETESLIYHTRKFFSGMEFFLMTPMFLLFLPSYKSSADKFLCSTDWLRKYYLANLIKERRKEIEKTPIDQELTPDMLTLMLTFNTLHDKSQVNDEQPLKPMDDEEVCGNIIEAIAGGVETTADVICVAIYYACQNPEIKQRIVEEIQKVIDLNSDFDYEVLNKLHYCEAVIKEASRILTTVPVIFRMAEHADEICGHKFEGSTIVMIDAQGINMNKSYWKDPEEFNPERFLSNDDGDGKIQKNSFHMFGGGIRMCPGRKLAMAELKTFMVLLFGRYNVELVDYSAPFKTSFALTRHCKELELKLIPRK